MSCDYSQVELRVLAHMAQDKLLLESFLNGQDVHARTAAEVFGVPLEQVDSMMRTRAKAVNFGIVYGISDFGLAKQLDISRGEAAEYIKNYFARYTGVKKYMDDTVNHAREQGYVATCLDVAVICLISGTVILTYAVLLSALPSIRQFRGLRRI